MKLLAAALAALLLAPAEPAPVTPESLLAEPHPERFDYFALKGAHGVKGLIDLRQGALAVLDRQGLGYAGPGCMTANQARVLTGLALAAQSASAEAFAADRAEGEALITEAAAAWARLEAGEDLGPGYQYVRSALQRSKQAPDARLRELFVRHARDQFVRVGSPRAMRNGPGGIVDRPAFYASQVGAAEWCRVDQDNTAWLKAQLKDHGWFRISRDGEAADAAAFLIVQHADRDRAFQGEMLPVLEKLAAEKETQARSYAYLYDRLASAEKRPQRYGTQGRCVAGGRWEPNPLEEPGGVDERRAAVRLGPLAEYQAGFKDRCP